VYVATTVQRGVHGNVAAYPIFFREYFGFGFIIVFVCIAWLAQQLNLWWGVFLGLPALFIGVYPALENFGSEKLVSGAVVAFNQEGCPLGWSPYTRAFGRVLVGAGKGVDEQNRALTERKLWQFAGEEKHQLTVAEMPKHKHGIQLVPHNDYQRAQPQYWGIETAGQGAGEDKTNPPRFSDNAGGDVAHNVMPPFTVVTFCMKD
jgi:hypothetical protein